MSFISIPDIIQSSTVDPMTSTHKSTQSRDDHSTEVVMERGTIYPFPSSQRSTVHSVFRELGTVLQDNEAKRILVYVVINVLGAIILLLWCHTTNSIALTAYTYLTLFDILSLLVCLLTLWIQGKKPSPLFSFGYERFEVLAVFSSTMLAQLGSLFILKESVERCIEQPDIHQGRLLPGCIFAFVLHLVTKYSMNNPALDHVIAASTSSWLQEHAADMSQSLCHVIPGLSKFLLPRLNPLILVASVGGFAVFFAFMIIDTKQYMAVDTWVGVCIAIMIIASMFPMSVYTGKILLQTTPSHMVTQLDKVLREVSTLDGVLEFRKEHFWTLSFGVLAGSVQVRIRRDADEQLVLAHVHDRLSNFVSLLTIQIVKDDWTQPMSYHMFSSHPGLTSPTRALSPPPFEQSYMRMSPYTAGVPPHISVTAVPPSSHGHSH